MTTPLLHRRATRIAVTLALVLAPTAAAAQELDAERFKPSITHDGFVNADGSNVRPTADPWELGAYLHYGRHQLVTVDQAGELRQKVISGRLGGDLFASFTIAKPFAVGLGVPFFLAQTGDQDPDFAGLGDIRLVPKLRILDDREDGIGLGVAAELRAPTHVGDFSGGTRMPVFAPRLIVDHRWISGFRLGANAGATIRERTDFFNVVAASELAYAVAAEYRFGGIEGTTGIGAELLGGVGLASSRTPNASSASKLPHELFFFLKHDPSPELELVAGLGLGVVAGYGVPIARGFVGILYRPTSHDADHDGISDDQDKCPNEAEDRDGVDDGDGCPEEDTDQDGIADADDRCPGEKETINGFKDDDGCADEGPAKVIVEAGEIKILETVKFKTGSAEIDPDSHSILDQVALTMKAHPEIKKIRVEGHTDETGTRELNLRLSQQRAQAVREYIVRKGVKPERLSAKGYGPDKPIAEGTSDEARAKNRRVEFIVED